MRLRSLTSCRPAIRRLLELIAGLLWAVAPAANAQSVLWPSFGPDRALLRLQGLTDILPDFVGPIDGSAELTIFTEGNHYPVLLPLVLDAFPAWCARTGTCHADPARILVVTLPQPMVVEMLLKGGIRLGNAIVPVGRDQRVFPDLVMAGAAPLGRLAAAGLLADRAVVFARHRGLGLLLRREFAGVHDLRSFGETAPKIVLASASEAGARQQYKMTLNAMLGEREADRVLAHEIESFAGRLGIQHRDVPYALLNGLADGGIIFDHLAAYYARQYPDRLRHVDVPAAERFGQPIAIAETTPRKGVLTASFERFFLEAARTAYPSGGFSPIDTFPYGATLALGGK